MPYAVINEIYNCESLSGEDPKNCSSQSLTEKQWLRYNMSLQNFNPKMKENYKY